MNKFVRNILIFIICIALLIFCFSKCTSPEKFKVKKPVSRIISLAPNLTELVYVLDCGVRLVGVTYDCNYPEDTKEKNKIGYYGKPYLERIVALNPQLVLCDEAVDSLFIKKIESLRIPVRQYSIRSLAELYAATADLGEILEKDALALQLVYGFKRRIDSVKKRTRFKKPIRVFMQIWDAPLMGVGGEGYLNEAIKLSGGENVFQHLPLVYPELTEEQILKTDPEIIIQLQKNSRYFQKTYFRELRAVVNHLVVSDLNSDLLLRPGPRLIDGIEALAVKLNRCRRVLSK